MEQVGQGTLLCACQAMSKTRHAMTLRQSNNQAGKKRSPVFTLSYLFMLFAKKKNPGGH